MLALSLTTKASTVGYTHYFGIKLNEVTPEQISRFAGDAELIFAGADKAEITLVREWDEPGTRPSSTGGVVAFNGLGGDGHETFYFDPTPSVRPAGRRPRGDLYALARNDASKAELAWAWIDYEKVQGEKGLRWAFCKTARKPYDAAVGAVLIRAKAIFGNAADISSDGRFDDESDDYATWAGARRLYRSVFGEEGTSPMTKDDTGLLLL
jgi:hypothetical protein